MIPLSSVKFQANKASDFCFLWHSLGMCPCAYAYYYNEMQQYANNKSSI